MVTGNNPNEVMGQIFKGPRSHLRGAGTFLHHAEISTEVLEFYTLTGHNQTEFLGSKFCGRPQGNREQLQNPGTIF